MGFVYYPDRALRDLRILALHDAGFSARQIGTMLGCSHHTAWEVAHPEARARNMAQRRARNTSPEGLERQRQYRARKAN